MKPLVSAIITTRNRKHLLKSAIDSVLAQTYSPIELIVVDDGSDDGTSDICQSPSIKYIYITPQESRGGNYARNLGIKHSSGTYVAFLDDDDEWLPEKIEKQVKLAEEKQSSLVYCRRFYHQIKDGQVVTISKEIDPKPFGDLHNIIFKHYITSTSCLLASKKMLEEVGGFDENLRKWQEYDLMIRMAERTNVYYVDDFLCNYRIDPRDAYKISNDFDRVYETIQTFKAKYADRIRALPFKVKIYFYDMCVCEIYKLAKKARKKRLQMELFLPIFGLRIFKKVTTLGF